MFNNRERLTKLWYINTMGYYTAMKNDDDKNKEKTTVCNTISSCKKETIGCNLYLTSIM